MSRKNPKTRNVRGRRIRLGYDTYLILSPEESQHTDGESVHLKQWVRNSKGDIEDE